MSFFVELIDSISLMSEEIPQFCNDMRECKEDIQEIMTDGVKEIIIENNDNYKTSSELRGEAVSTIHAADKKLAEAQAKTKELVDQLYNENTRLLERRSMVLHQYDPAAPALKELHQKAFDPGLSQPTLSWSRDDEYLLLGIRSMPEFLARYDRVNASKKYLSDAQDYSVQADGEVARLIGIQNMVSIVLSSLKEEIALLDTIKSLSLKTGSPEQAQIRYQLRVIMTENFLSPTCERSAAYQKAIHELTSLCAKYR